MVSDLVVEIQAKNLRDENSSFVLFFFEIVAQKCLE